MKKIYVKGERYRLHNRITIDNVTEDIIKKEAGDFEFKCTKLKFDKKDGTYNQAHIALIPCGFDIETYKQFMYIWTFTLRDLTIIGYTWQEFSLLLETIKKALHLYRDTKTTKHKDGTIEETRSAIKVLPVYIHNIEFEWSFIKSVLNVSEKPFYMDSNERDPLYAISDDAFLWMDSYKVYPMKLEEVAKIYCVTQKAVGDLDYDKARNYEDAKHLTQKELDYCCKDTIILSELMRFTFNNYFLVYGKLPMTQNQIIKSIIKKEYKEKFDAMTKNEQEQYKKYLHSLMISQYQYSFIRDDGFRGGFCQSNGGVCETKKDEIVVGADITSAYFTAILHKKFPMSEYQVADDKDLNQILEYYTENFCCQIRARFINLECKDDKMIKLETRQKVVAFMPNGKVATTKEEQKIARTSIETNTSGRIARAANIIVSITDLDYYLYKKIYKWDKMEVLEIQYAKADFLPDYIRDAAIKLYEKKSALKKAGKSKSAEYKAIKTLVSNVFGAMVQKVDRDLVEKASEAEWKVAQLDNILRPQWGVYVAAHVRSILINMILAIGKEFWLYSDTDSIYFILNDQTKHVIDLYNAKQKLRNALLCNERGLNYQLFDDLGCFDDESAKNKVIYHFKALGAKSYMYFYKDNEHQNGSFELVLAGIPADYFWTTYRKKYPIELKNKEAEINRVFDFFNKNTPIAYERTLMDFDVSNTSEIINGLKCECKTGCKLVKEVIHGTLADVQEKIAIEHAFSDLADAQKRV